MDQTGIAKVLSVLLISATKFLWAPGTALLSGFSFFQTVLLTSIGGMLGISFFYFFGAIAIDRLERWRGKMRRNRPGKQKRIFTRRNRRIIRIKHAFGLIGLVVVTPCILSIPIGCVVAAKFYRHNRATYPLLLVSTVAWSLLLTGIFWNIYQF